MSDPNAPRDQNQPGPVPASYQQPAPQQAAYAQPGPQHPAATQPGYMQPGYTQPVYAAPPRGLSVASLVIGLVSFFLGFTVVLPLVGAILGFVGLRREPAGRGMAIAGIWINGLILVFGVILGIVVVLAVLGVIGAVTIPLLGEVASPAVPA
ncbi:MAG: hypothetical protein RI885_2052 [Actinomycetota bacterium]|jgi:hypothetical protein